MTTPRAKLTVLFLCTGNSARSQMAEALLRHRASDRFEVHSAGLDPQGVHPMTVRALAELGVDTEPLRSKHLDEYLGKTLVHHAIVVCENAEQRCPSVFPFANRRHFWPFEDPVAVAGSDDEQLAAFRRVRDEIDARLAAWLADQPAAREHEQA